MTTNAKMTNAQMNRFLNDVIRELPKEEARRERDPAGRTAIIDSCDRDPSNGQPMQYTVVVVEKTDAGLTVKNDGGDERIFIPWHRINRFSWLPALVTSKESKSPS